MSHHSPPPLHALGCSLHPSPRPPSLHSSPRSLHRSSVIRPAIDRSRSWCSGGAADPFGVDYSDAALSSSLYYHPPPPLGIFLSSLRLSLSSLGPSVSLFFHPSALRRSVHPSSGPEPIRCPPPPLSHSVSPPHSVFSDSSLIFSSVLSIFQ